MMLSIVIPVKNEEENIKNLLDCLDKQSFKDFDIIIADSNSTDHTLVNIISHKLFYKDKKIRIVKGGLPSVGRNNGSKKSNSKFILFIDADGTINDVDLIQKSIDLIIKKKLDLITTNLSCRNNFKVKFIYFLNNSIQYLSKFDMPFSTGMYFFIRRTKFIELGGFNEDDQYAEDYNLSRKVEKHKFGIVNSVVYSDDRRFKKTGYFGVMKLFIKTFLNKNDENYYKEKINYFND